MAGVTCAEEPVTRIGRVDPVWWIVLGSLLGAAVLCGAAALILSRPVVDDGLRDGVFLLSVVGPVVVLASMAISYAVLDLVRAVLNRS
jgi:hypothetical protein